MADNKTPSDETRQDGPQLEAEPETAGPVELDGEILSEESDETERPPALPYLLAAVGASAGGVEAYIQFVGALAPDSGIAYVLIPHLLPSRKSHMVDILARHTQIPVLTIEDGMTPRPNQISIVPAGAQVAIKGGVFRLEPRQPDGNRVIDHFFRSLATDQRTHAIGVVLSGTDSDGALGLKAIKGEGGISLVQRPETAGFPEMPRTSISADHVDKILSPVELAGELAELGRQFRKPIVRNLDGSLPPVGEEQAFARILNLLRGVSGIDFRLYKPTTIRRRIARRMLLHRFETLTEYVGFIQGNPKELRELQEDALINVTRFFRDAAVFDTLKESILPRLFEDREPEQQVRVWVAGCSTGEEVYSIAISLLEYLTGQPFEPPIQIFGTDASDLNIQKARMGIFPESIAGEVSTERLRRFFVKVDKGFQVSKRVRDLCIFARQNLSYDPPFSKMDLISCRNVLIYLGTELQRQILPTFHYALRQNGFLLLGTSETIREFTELFQQIDRKHKFFAKVGTSHSRAAMSVTPRLFLQDTPAPSSQPGLSQNWGDIELQRAADRIVLARYGPPGVIVDEKLEILQSRGHTAAFMEMPQGSVTLQLTRMLRDSISSSVTQVVRHAIEQDIPVRMEGLHLAGSESEQEVVLEVLPIHTTVPRSRCFLVLFVPANRALTSAPLPAEAPALSTEGREQDQTVERLRQDLASTKLYLQTLLDERDAKNQELVSANEEIQSANEEMQSTNEELETTKEELQSSNEELQTVNDELQQRNATLTQTTNDLSNLLNSVNLPVLMLSNELHIRHFTPPTQRLMNLRVPDIGRPFSEIRFNLNTEDLAPLFSDVLETLAPREIEVQDHEGKWYLLRVRPYRTTDNKIEGVVVVLVDIDQLRRSQQELRGARDFARSVIESVPLPLVVVDRELRIRSVNDAFRTLVNAGREDLERRSFIDLALAHWGLDEPLRSRLQTLQESKKAAHEFEFEYRTPDETPRTFNIRARLLPPDGEVFILITIEDITPHKEVERLLGLERERLTSEVALTARELGRTQDELRALTASLFTSQEDERRRVARELHDDVAQRFAMLEIESEKLTAEAGVSPEKVRELTESLRAGIAAASDEVRRIAHALHPSALEDLGITPALRALVENFRGNEQMMVTFSADGAPAPLPIDVATGVYRIAQEALRNANKHAGRAHVKVLLRGTPSGIRLQVTDSGEGFDPHAPRTGLGLISMEERARLMGGTLKVESKMGEGTRITVDVPVNGS